jgi:hypothetical protein
VLSSPANLLVLSFIYFFYLQNNHWSFLPRSFAAQTLCVSSVSATVRKAKHDAGPKHVGDGKFRHPH